MEAYTSPTTQSDMSAPSQAPIITSAEHSGLLADHLERCRETFAVQDRGQWAIMASRVDVIENNLTEVVNTVEGLRSDISSLETTLSQINSRLSEMSTSMTAITFQFTQIDTRLTDMSSRSGDRFTQTNSRFAAIDSRFTDVESRIDSRFHQADLRINNRFDLVDTQVADLGSQLTAMDTHIDDRFNQVDSRFAEMAAKNVKSQIRMEALLTAYTYDVLEPLYNLDTGAEIEAIHSRADLEGSHSISYSGSSCDGRLFDTAGNRARKAKGG
ncbi:hypothetical protein E4U32_005722 [Claviceps aff. humidiphila group G2b]|nr:hypothetical protein E4U32_005722 [Claviceps aff. humidiphila group G2b]